MTGALPSPAPRPLLGRDELLADIQRLLRSGQNVLLFGPAGTGKSSVIRALLPEAVCVIDPFEHIDTRHAARIRRAIGRGTVHLAAARSLERSELGAVRRIAFWFVPVRVPPLSARLMERLLLRACQDELAAPAQVTTRWMRGLLRRANGCPGVVLELVRTSADWYRRQGSLPSPATAAIEMRLATLTRHLAGPAELSTRPDVRAPYRPDFPAGSPKLAETAPAMEFAANRCRPAVDDSCPAPPVVQEPFL